MSMAFLNRGERYETRRWIYQQPQQSLWNLYSRLSWFCDFNGNPRTSWSQRRCDWLDVRRIYNRYLRIDWCSVSYNGVGTVLCGRP